MQHREEGAEVKGLEEELASPAQPIDKSEEMRMKSTASRSSEKADYMSQNLTHYVDSRKRAKKRTTHKKPIINFSSEFSESADHSLKFE